MARRRWSLLDTSSSPCSRSTDRLLWCSAVTARYVLAFIGRAFVETSSAVTGKMALVPVPHADGGSRGPHAGDRPRR